MREMRKLIFVLIVFILALPAQSQIKFGLKAGVSTDFTFTDLNFKESGIDVAINSAKDAEWGFQGGAFLRGSIGSFFIQPELLFATATNSVKYDDVQDGGSSIIMSQKYNKLNIPLLLGIHLGPVRINAGPAGSVMIGEMKEAIQGATYKRATFGYQAGLGLDLFNRLSLDVRYEGNLNQFGESITIGGHEFTLDDRTGALLFQVGLIF